MKFEKIKMKLGEKDRISKILEKDGLLKTEIDEILNGYYSTFENQSELQISMKDIFQNKKYNSIIQGIAGGYTLDEMPKIGVSSKRVREFSDMLNQNNLTTENVAAFNRYSSGSNMILSHKRGTSKEDINNGIINELQDRLKQYNFSETQIENIQKFVSSLDYDKPLHESFDSTNEYLQQYKLAPKYLAAIQSSIQNMNSLHHLGETISSLDEGLKTKLPNSIKLYRAVKSDFLKEKFNIKNNDYSNLIGANIEDNSYSSTSPLYDSSFAKYDDFDVVMELYVPKGSQGTSINPFSSYGDAESEILLNSNDIYITDVSNNIIDENKKSKTVLKALLLSKERECYKGIGNPIQEKTINYDELNFSRKEHLNSNLPAKENRYQSFFNKIKSKWNEIKNGYNTFKSKDAKSEDTTILYENTKKEKNTNEIFNKFKTDFQQDLESKIYNEEVAKKNIRNAENQHTNIEKNNHSKLR